MTRCACCLPSAFSYFAILFSPGALLRTPSFAPVPPAPPFLPALALRPLPHVYHILSLPCLPTTSRLCPLLRHPLPLPFLDTFSLTVHPPSPLLLRSTYMHPGPPAPGPSPPHPHPPLRIPHPRPFARSRSSLPLPPIHSFPLPASRSCLLPSLLHPPALSNFLAISRALPSRRLRPHLPPSVSPTNTPPTRNFIFDLPRSKSTPTRSSRRSTRAPASPPRAPLLYLVRGRESERGLPGRRRRVGLRRAGFRRASRVFLRFPLSCRSLRFLPPPPTYPSFVPRRLPLRFFDLPCIHPIDFRPPAPWPTYLSTIPVPTPARIPSLVLVRFPSQGGAQTERSRALECTVRYAQVAPVGRRARTADRQVRNWDWDWDADSECGVRRSRSSVPRPWGVRARRVLWQRGLQSAELEWSGEWNCSGLEQHLPAVHLARILRLYRTVSARWVGAGGRGARDELTCCLLDTGSGDVRRKPERSHTCKHSFGGGGRSAVRRCVSRPRFASPIRRPAHLRLRLPLASPRVVPPPR
ncbi:hypothetical protein B0H11DRAFT_565144 [Mycena galericulata]|nr:hypothetical protein B0H11DRAFT_565144 [Mycena galericulata]